MKRPLAGKRGAAKTVVADLVHQIMQSAHTARTDGPSSGLYGRDAQVSGALTQAGTWLAKQDQAAPSKRPSLMNSLLGGPAPKAKRRSWLFASKSRTAMPDAKRIEQLLRASAKGGRLLALERELATSRLAHGDVDCTLPDGAVDPVCKPR